VTVLVGFFCLEKRRFLAELVFVEFYLDDPDFTINGGGKSLFQPASLIGGNVRTGQGARRGSLVCSHSQQILSHVVLDEIFV
jgi:hypothetical protein